MTNFRSRREYSSRLAREETKRFTFQALVFTVLAFIIVAAVIVIGIPALIKMAVVLGDLKNSQTPLTPTDTIAPAAPQLIPIPEATSSADLNVEGYAESGSSVSLFLNGSKVKETVADESGMFSFAQVPLIDGSNALSATTKDPAGNQSPASTQLTIMLYQEKPEISLTSPKDGEKFYGLSHQQITVEGITTSQNRVTVNDKQAVVSSNGTFKYRLLLKEGDNTITATTIDPAGNTNTQSVTVSYQP